MFLYIIKLINFINPKEGYDFIILVKNFQALFKKLTVVPKAKPFLMIPLKSKDSNFMHYYNEVVMSFSDICTITKDVITYSAQPNFVAFFLIRKKRLHTENNYSTFPSVDKNHNFACKLPLEH